MNSYWNPQKLDRWDALIGAAVGLGTFWLLMATLDIGYTRDESFYFHAAAQYIGWFEDLWKNLWNTNFPASLAESFSKENIDKHWSYNPEHPVLVKTLFALSHKLFFDQLGWLSESDALRLPGAAFGSMALLCAYAFARQCFGRLAGVVAVGALLLQPRFFFNAHLTCFDVPIAALWMMVVYAYWRSLYSKRWAWVTGILFGLALSAKLNAFFLPFVLCGHWFLVHWRGFGILGKDKEDGKDEDEDEQLKDGHWRLGKFRLPPIPWGLVAMAILGPILFHILWPYHYYNTWDRVEWYLNFHLKHVHYFVWYFGTRLDEPPFPIGFPWVMTLVTVPATLLLTFWFGVWAALRKWRFVEWSRQWIAALRARKLPATRGAEAGFDPRGTGLLFAINLLFPIALISWPSTPVFGGTKHWIVSMIFLAIFVGAGVSMAVQMALRALDEWQKSETSADATSGEPPRRPIAHALLAAILSLAVLGPAAYATWYNYPFGSSYYNELIGSYRGAADAGMMRQFWGYASRQSLPWINEHAPKNGRVWTHNTTSWAWNMYEKDGIARKDLRPASIESSQIGIFHHQRAFTWERQKLWAAYGSRTPSHVVDIDGVPLISVYERPKKTVSKKAAPKRKTPQKTGEKNERPEE